MEANAINVVLLPIALGIIMLGLGLTLSLGDFKRVLLAPKPVLAGLAIQMLVLTTVCFLICLAFKLPAELAVGMMLLAASPGGASANIYSHLAHGDVALNITLTAVNSVLSLITLPLIVGAAMVWFMGSDQAVPPPFKKIVEVGLIILLPVALGMWLRSRAPRIANRLEKPTRIFSVLLLAALVAISVTQQWEVLVSYLTVIGLACLSFNLLSLAIGYGLPRALRLPRRQAIAIAMEIGIHNGTLAIFIALNILDNGVMSVPAAVYSLIMFITAGVFAWWLNRKSH
jgi:BASS family bile acid:Na+ symporter